MNKQFTFHVVGLPHTVTSKEYVACAYTQKVLNFCKMMKSLGHTVYHYGGEGSEVECDEHITLISTKEREKFWGKNDWKKDFFDIEWDPNIEYWKLSNNRAIEEIRKRADKKDFVCLIGGTCQKPIAVGLSDMMSVEFGIGYQGTFAKYKVYESYSHMHRMYGKTGVENGNFYDTVIPNYFDPKDFPFSDTKEDYFLFIGRMISRKGVMIASAVAKHLGKKLILAGQGARQEGNKVIAKEFTLEGDHLEYIGTVDVKKRGELMSKAKAVFVPTLYLEPFGGVNIEAQMCGTPVITTDFGAFTETVLHGYTGYRCKTLEQFIWAGANVDMIEPQACKDWATQNYSIDNIRYMYEEYFAQLYDLWDKGWNQLNPERTSLSFLEKIYPIY